MRGAALLLVFFLTPWGGLGVSGDSSEPSIAQVAQDDGGAKVIEHGELSHDATWFLSEEPLLSIGVDIGDEPYLFTDIGDVHLLPDGSLVVMEERAREVRFYGPDGAYIRRFGRRGQGPGEFQAIGHTQVEGDEIRIWDRVLRRLSTFTLTGELLETQPILGPVGRFFVRGFFPDGTLLVSLTESILPPSGGLVSIEETLVRWSDESSTQLGSIVTVEYVDSVYDDGSGRRRSAPLPLLPVPSPGRAAGASNVYLIAGESFEYRRYDLDGTADQIVRVAERAETIPADFVAAYKRAQIQGAPESLRPAQRAFFERIPFPDHFPVVDQIFLDTEENVWIRRYRVPLRAAGEDQIFHVFDPAGAAIGTVHVPGQLELRLVTTDRLIGRWTDEMGVQSVRVYALGGGDVERRVSTIMVCYVASY